MSRKQVRGKKRDDEYAEYVPLRDAGASLGLGAVWRAVVLKLLQGVNGASPEDLVTGMFIIGIVALVATCFIVTGLAHSAFGIDIFPPASRTPTVAP